MTETSRPSLPLPSNEFHDRVEQHVLPLLKARRRKRLVLMASVGAIACLLFVLLQPETLVRMTMLLQKLGPQVSAKYEFVPVSARVEANDIFVQGVVEDVAYDWDEVIGKILSGTPGAFYATVTIRVVESYPPIPDKSIQVSGTIGEGFAEGREYVIPLKRRDDGYFHEFSFGIHNDYEIRGKGDESAVSLTGSGESMPLNKGWILIRSLYDAIQGRLSIPPSELLDSLKNHDFIEAAATLEVLSLSSPRVYTDADLVEALEKHYERIMADDPGTMGDYGPEWKLSSDVLTEYRRFAMSVLKLLNPISSETAVDRLVALYLQDRTTPNAQAFDNPQIEVEVLRLALTHPGPHRESRLRSILGRKVVFEGKHGPYGRETIGVPTYATLMLIAQTPGSDTDRLLRDILEHPEEFLLNPESHAISEDARAEYFRSRRVALATLSSDPHQRLQMCLEQLAEGRTDMLTTIVLRTGSGDTSVLPFLLQGEHAPAAAAAIVRKVPDPALLPALREALCQRHWDARGVVEGMAACGARDEAITLAEEVLAIAFPETWQDFLYDTYLREGALLALGTLGGDRAEALATIWIGPEADAYETAEQQAKRAHTQRTGDYSLTLNLRLAARLALTKMGLPDADDLWRPLWNKGGSQERMTAAMALHYLGDDTGREFIDAFAAQTDKEIPELHRHLNQQGMTGEFQAAIRYLRSPELDTLFLERIQHGIQSDDTNLINDAQFEMQHAGIVLPLLVQHLESRDRDHRHVADLCLQSLLGADVRWDKYVLRQPEKVQQWREEVEAFLAGFTPVVTSTQTPHDGE